MDKQSVEQLVSGLADLAGTLERLSEAGQFPAKIDELIGKKQVMKITSLTARLLDRLVDDGRIPAPMKITRNTWLWKKSEIKEWIDNGCRSVDTAED
jgi:predicted DNA-binding transcriptional regulator AlpA